MSKNTSARDALIRVRVEADLPAKLARVAKKKNKKLSEFLREHMWNIANEASNGPQK